MSAPSTEALAITRASKSNLALAFVSLPRERREDMTVFYAWCRVIDDIAAHLFCRLEDEIDGQRTASDRASKGRRRQRTEEKLRQNEERFRQIAENVRIHRFDRESIMLGVDSASSMIRYSLTSLDSNKPINLRLAHFAQFKAGRLRSIRVLVDTFDLVEQALGHPIHLPRIAS